MAQEKGNACRFTAVAEVTRGTTPGTPSMKQLSAAVYGESFGPKIGSVMSKSIRGKRGRSKPRGGEITVDGSVPFELAPLGLAWLLKQALGNAAAPSGAGPYTHVIKRGALLPGITIEKGFTGLGKYFVHPGCLVNGMSLNINPENSLVEGSFDFIGMGEPTTSDTSLGVPTVPVHVPFAEFEAEIEEDGNPVTVLNFGMNFSNEIERVPVVGSRYAGGLNEGEGTVDVTTSLMFTSMDQVDKWLDETETSLQLKCTAGAASMTFLFPKAKYFGDTMPKITTAQGIVVPLTATCYYDTTEATDIKVTVVNSEATI